MTSKRNHTFMNRLFTKVAKAIEKPESINQLRGDVFLLTFKNHNPLILKGFYSYEKWYRQQQLTSLLMKNGFNRVYQMYKEPRPFMIEGLWYGFIEYLPPSGNSFTFSNHSDRIEGLELLENFHQTAEHISISLSSFNQIIKWQDRLEIFHLHVPAIREHMSESFLKEWISWGEWSLKGLKNTKAYLKNEKKTIIHGDCAHHNFLRKTDQSLSLIDFDLISKAPRIYDYLQYANRILPYLDHPATEIWEYPQIKAYEHNPAFLYALAYPSDIFREWNLLFKRRFHLQHVLKISVEDFEKRMNFNQSLAKLIGTGV